LTYSDSDSNSDKFNERADFLINSIGANPLPADTKIKRIYVNWGEYQNKSIPIQVHKSRKEKGEYNNGLAVMTGPIHRGKNEGKYLVGIDCDNRKAIDEICIELGFKNIDELSKWTWTEQHKDNLNKAHIYILATKPFKNKGRDPKFTELESRNEVPAIEIKCERQNMFTAPSIHANGYPYEILGTKEPALCDEFESHLDNIFRKYGIDYLFQEANNSNLNSININNNGNGSSSSNSKLPDSLRQLIILLEIPPDFQYRIHEGTRHSTLLSFANSLLYKYKYDTNINRKDELKNFFYQVNNMICTPTPLPDIEIKNIWKDAVKRSEEKISKIKIVNDDENDPSNYKTQVIIPLEIGDKLLEKEIVQNLVYDLQTNSIDCRLNSKYKPGTRVIVPISIKQWPDVRKNFKNECQDKGIDEEDTLLLLESIDNNVDLIKKHYLENHRKHNAALAAASEEQKKQRLQLIEEGTEFVMAKYRFITIIESKEILYYDSNRGVYVPGGEIIIDQEIDKKYGYKLKTNDINEIKNYVIRKTYTKRESIDSNLDIVNLTNGLYNLKTGEFTKHTPYYYSINQKPFPYNPKARTKRFIKFLKEVLWPEDILTAIDIIAYTFLRYNPHELYIILIGVGANGKSVYTGLITNLHGSKNVSNVPLKSLLNNTFALANLENKDVNIDTELSGATINDMSILKRLTGKQPIRIERKRQDAYDTILHAKLIFNANQMPNNADNSDARIRREIPLSFPNQFEGSKDDPDLLNKLSTKDEMSGIFNIIAHVLRNRIIKTQRIHINQKTINERREKAELTRDPINAFVKDAISKDSTISDFVIVKDLYIAYGRFCKYRGLPMQNKDRFSKILENNPYNYQKDRKMIGEKKKTVWIGVRLIKWDSNYDHLQQTLSSIDSIGEEEQEEQDV
jgi:putative DNA primase/helicase